MILTLSDNKLYWKVLTENDSEDSSIRFWMRRRADKYMFHPLYKKKKWDGYINFFDNNTIPFGLYGEVKELCAESNIELKLRGLRNIVDFDFEFKDFEKWVFNFFKDSNVFPRDYQIKSAYKIIKYSRSLSEISTGGGKTLIMYMVFAYLHYTGKSHRSLIVVPSISLIEQTLEKFLIYLEDSTLPIKFKIQMVMGGTNKELREGTNLVIGTFQSLCKMEREWFSEFDSICVDESHYAKTKSIQDLFKMIPHIHFRFGVSGTTLTNKKTSESYGIQANIGPVVGRITNQELTEEGFLTPVEIHIHYLDYLEKEKKEQLAFLKSKNKNSQKATMVLGMERKFITTSKLRFSYITALIKNLKGNTLALFNDVKGGYGTKIAQFVRDQNPDRNVFYIDGITNNEARDSIFKSFDPNTETILVASYGTTSTGIDISCIDNIIFLESFKSDVRIIQSIGRGVRKHEGKEKVAIYDLVDDFTINKISNYVKQHGEMRKVIYKQQGFPVVEKKKVPLLKDDVFGI